ncbi:MAG: hypothetical protein HQK77_19815, partial [Desulfobacterales bacterium]|nr:hypothetical protein [Desulfobacterales bacterium]
MLKQCLKAFLLKLHHIPSLVFSVIVLLLILPSLNQTMCSYYHELNTRAIRLEFVQVPKDKNVSLYLINQTVKVSFEFDNSHQNIFMSIDAVNFRKGKLIVNIKKNCLSDKKIQFEKNLQIKLNPDYSYEFVQETESLDISWCTVYVHSIQDGLLRFSGNPFLYSYQGLGLSDLPTRFPFIDKQMNPKRFLLGKEIVSSNIPEFTYIDLSYFLSSTSTNDKGYVELIPVDTASNFQLINKTSSSVIVNHHFYSNHSYRLPYHVFPFSFLKLISSSRIVERITDYVHGIPVDLNGKAETEQVKPDMSVQLNSNDLFIISGLGFSNKKIECSYIGSIHLGCFICISLLFLACYFCFFPYPKRLEIEKTLITSSLLAVFFFLSGLSIIVMTFLNSNPDYIQNFDNVSFYYQRQLISLQILCFFLIISVLISIFMTVLRKKFFSRLIINPYFLNGVSLIYAIIFLIILFYVILAQKNLNVESALKSLAVLFLPFFLASYFSLSLTPGSLKN